MKFLFWIDRRLSTIENALLIILLAAMVSLGFLQVLLRNFFNTGIQGADEFLRHLVLVVAFFGASQAARSEKHIKIDILSRHLNKFRNNIVAVIINLFSMAVTLFLAVVAWKFIMIERGSGETAVFGIKIWVYQIIIPLGFTLIGFRFFLHFLDMLVKTVRRSAS